MPKIQWCKSTLPKMRKLSSMTICMRGCLTTNFNLNQWTTPKNRLPLETTKLWSTSSRLVSPSTISRNKIRLIFQNWRWTSSTNSSTHCQSSSPLQRHPSSLTWLVVTFNIRMPQLKPKNTRLKEECSARLRVISEDENLLKNRSLPQNDSLN